MITSEFEVQKYFSTVLHNILKKRKNNYDVSEISRLI